jgi:hypothetical protein
MCQSFIFMATSAEQMASTIFATAPTQGGRGEEAREEIGVPSFYLV